MSKFIETDEFRIAANAKINIGLRIVGKRSDGFHNLESVFQEINLSDIITIRKIPHGIRIMTSHSQIPTDEQNLCYQAFLLMKKTYGFEGGVEISLEKNIPVGAGLGGGSSDAAACLKAFNHIFNLNLNKSRLIHLAAKIGSDVPFFIIGKTALVKGRGEVVVPIDFLKDYQILIVYPYLNISTTEVYKNFELNLTNFKSLIKFDVAILKIAYLQDLNYYFYNDLEKVVFRFYPELREAKEKLKLAGAAFASLSGSGSVLYGLFDESIQLKEIKEEFEQYGQVFIAKPVI